MSESECKDYGFRFSFLFLSRARGDENTLKIHKLILNFELHDDISVRLMLNLLEHFIRFTCGHYQSVD